MTFQTEAKTFLANVVTDVETVEADAEAALAIPQVAALAPVAEAALTGFLASKGVPVAELEVWGEAILSVLNGVSKQITTTTGAAK